jgi:hypothetical protein
MLFKLLRLAGIDVNVKIAELKADLTHTARTTGLVAGLFLGAAILALMVLIVALIALYKWGELHHGVFVGLALVSGVLIMLAAILVVVGLTMAKQGGKTAVLRHIRRVPRPTRHGRRKVLLHINQAPLKPRTWSSHYLRCSPGTCAGRKRATS